MVAHLKEKRWKFGCTEEEKLLVDFSRRRRRRRRSDVSCSTVNHNKVTFILQLVKQEGIILLSSTLLKTLDFVHKDNLPAFVFYSNLRRLCDVST